MIGQKGIPAKFGGVERHVHDLAVRLASRNHDVTVYSREWYAGHTDTKYKGVHIVTLPTLKTKHLDTVTHTLLATIHAIKSDAEVIHYHGVGPSLFSWIPRVFAPQKRVVNTFHSIDRKHEKWGIIARLALRFGEWAACAFAHQTISVSETIKQYARDVYNAPTVYIPNAIELPEQKHTADSLHVFDLEPQKYVVIVSRLIEHKGIHYAIRAWKKLKKDQPEILKDLKLAIVGDGHYTDEYVRSLKTLAGKDKDIVFTGFRDGFILKELFANALMQIHPSDNEGLPIVVLEGMGYGLPVLVSDIIEHKGLVTDFRYRFTPGNVPALAAQLKEILELHEDERWLAGQRNRSLIAREYTWDVVMEQLEAVYAPEKVSQPESIVTA